jgi:DNA-directed RNA polymerase subunit RPC12/RpoP
MSHAKAPSVSAASNGQVKLQKRETAPKISLREKQCATCGRIFELSPDQKFYDCPECYERKHPGRKPFHRKATQLLVQIRCIQCGKTEFLDVQPPDPQAALCKVCFLTKRREENENRIRNREP